MKKANHGTFVCEICKKEIIKNAHNQKYCKDCKKIAKKNQYKKRYKTKDKSCICKLCRKKFIKKANSQKYCCIECRLLYNKSNKNKKSKKKILKKCEYCSIEFKGYSHRKFCSTSCYNNSRLVSKICPICGIDFVVRKSQSDRKFCSMKCSSEYLSLIAPGKKEYSRKCKYCDKIFKTIDKRQKYCCSKCKNKGTIRTKTKKRKSVTCQFCNKDFQVIYNSKQKYCSNKCRRLGRRPKEYICKLCGKNFRITARTNRNPTYCSRECYYKSIEPDTRKCIVCGTDYLCPKNSVRRFCSRKCFGAAISKDNNLVWPGRVYFYPTSWNDSLKTLIRERDNHTCQICGKTTEENRKNLHVHHIDYDKKNLKFSNLISLCSSCHSYTNYNREFYQSHFQYLIKIKYENDPNLIEQSA